MENRKKTFFNSLQVYRGIAALLVVFHHEMKALKAFFHVDNSTLDLIGQLGKFGVDFFFVLSGFIITYSNRKWAGELGKSGRYLVNRAIRIYTPYLLIGFVMLIAYNLFPDLSKGEERDISVISSLTLLPFGPPALSVAWTLIHEIQFYLLFLLWFFSKKLWNIWVVLWTISIIFFSIFQVNGQVVESYFLSTLLSPYNLEFIIGYFCAIFFCKFSPLGRSTFMVFGVLFFAAFFFLFLNQSLLTISSLVMTIVLGSGFAAVIIASAGSALDSLGKGNVFMIIGNASYSIYLLHDPLISLLARLFVRMDTQTLLVGILIFLVCIVTGVIYSIIFEQKILSYIKEKLFRTYTVRAKKIPPQYG